jgi:hypothetical protein
MCFIYIYIIYKGSMYVPGLSVRALCSRLCLIYILTTLERSSYFTSGITKLFKHRVPVFLSWLREGAVGAQRPVTPHTCVSRGVSCCQEEERHVGQWFAIHIPRDFPEVSVFFLVYLRTLSGLLSSTTTNDMIIVNDQLRRLWKVCGIFHGTIPTLVWMQEEIVHKTLFRITSL